MDRPLDAAAREALRAISSRATISATGFANHYDYGDLKADPVEMMKRWFDLHVYSGFHHVRIVRMRLPRAQFDAEAVQPYATKGCLTVTPAGRHTVLTIEADELDLGWDADPSGWMAVLAPLRTALLDGDLRCLYLAWLLGVQNGVVDADTPEPPRPPGLARLDGPLDAFADVFQIAPDLIAAAAERNRHLNAVARREDAAWTEAERLATEGKAASYDRTVPLLLDLKALADRDGTLAAFTKRLHGLRTRHAAKPSLMRRLDEAGLRVGPPSQGR